MAELKIFYRDKDKQDKIKVGRSVNILSSLDKKDIIWIDLLDVSDKTEGVLEDFLKIDIQDDEEMEEIEMSSRYIQTDDSIVANSNFLRDNFEMEPVNFILKNSIQPAPKADAQFVDGTSRQGKSYPQRPYLHEAPRTTECWGIYLPH